MMARFDQNKITAFTLAVIIIACLLGFRHYYITESRDKEPTEVIVAKGYVTDKRSLTESCGKHSVCETFYLSVDGKPVVVNKQTYAYNDVGSYVTLSYIDDHSAISGWVGVGFFANVVLSVLLLMASAVIFWYLLSLPVLYVRWTIKYRREIPFYKFVCKHYSQEE